jgi:hypothetical protein
MFYLEDNGAKRDALDGGQTVIRKSAALGNDGSGLKFGEFEKKPGAL